jgi:aconitate hydratase
MGKNVTRKLIENHLVSGTMKPGEEIGLKIDQTLTQDATGTMVMFEFEAMHVDRVRTELSAQYVDYNLIQEDFKNADDHLFLRSACRKFGLWYSRPGNGMSHPVHMERFGIPGKTMLGSDSHTPAAGSLGMLAVGAGGIEVAHAMAGEPFYVSMPGIWGVKLIGSLPDWVSAKDVILEMLRRHGVDGGAGKILEYYGPGLEALSAMDRHVIANMGTELGATSTVFPSDETVRAFLSAQGRLSDWVELSADADAEYDEYEEIDLSSLEPLIALPGSPGNVVPVRDVAGKEIYQSYIGSSANPGLRDFAITALVLDGRKVHDRVSLDINPTSRQILENLIALGLLEKLVHAGARLHQAGCNGCIGMGQAPGDAVYLCSPETAAVSALTGVITDPRTTKREYPRFKEQGEIILNKEMLVPPPADEEAQLEKGPNIKPLPEFGSLPDSIVGKVLLKVGDHVSTDEIMPAGAGILPYRSNIPAISRFVFSRIDNSFYERAMRDNRSNSFVVAGRNYGQGSSREHAALAPRYLGLRVVLAKSYARIHRQNLINFGILPLVFADPEDWSCVDPDEELKIDDLRETLQEGGPIAVFNRSKGAVIRAIHSMSTRQIQTVLEGGVINIIRNRNTAR